jgi:formylglycine-generating enzyme
MIPDWLTTSYGGDEEAQKYVALAQQLRAQGENEAAATAYDRAFGLAPDDAAIASARMNLLDQLAIVEHGIAFRYIPAGTFLMGSDTGDPDERPVHPVQLDAYWLSETPISWAKHCELQGWEPPPSGKPPDYEEIVQKILNKETTPEEQDYFRQGPDRKLCLQYCENETIQAYDWHRHSPEDIWTQAGKEVTAREIFGEVPRKHRERPWGYDEKPVVALGWKDAVTAAERASTAQALYRLPTEAEWEKAARGGLINARYPWGDDPPSPYRCDFDRFEQFSIQKMWTFPPNGYGLYGMSGGVWEWTSDWYSAGYYAESPRYNPPGPTEGQEKVLRGGSWADCGDALRVSFRMSYRDYSTPTIGYRLCRVRRWGNSLAYLTKGNVHGSAFARTGDRVRLVADRRTA